MSAKVREMVLLRIERYGAIKAWMVALPQIVVFTILRWHPWAPLVGVRSIFESFFPARYKPEPSYVSPLLNSPFS
jgi:hypothetical protein